MSSLDSNNSPRGLVLALRKHTPRPLRFILFLAVIYAFCWIKGWPKYYDDEELPRSQQQRPEALEGPHHVEREEIIVSVTSTAVDVYNKLPLLAVLTAPEDHEQMLFFSDLQMDVGQWTVFDVLWRFPQDFIAQARELGRYRAQVDYARKGLPIQDLKKQDQEEELAIQKRLDKYKILQAMAAAWEYRPNRSWYVFMSDDTWINRANLQTWLSQYDSKERIFLGNQPNKDHPDPFAAGGNTIILSGKVMADLFSPDSKEHHGFLKNWQNNIIDHASAFDLVSDLMQSELKVEVQAAWPILTGYDPLTMPFSQTLWCEPIAGMHHLSPDMASDLWNLEKAHTQDHVSSTPLRVADLWQHFMGDEDLNDSRKDWDNLSSESANARWNILFQQQTDRPEPGRATNGDASPQACEASCDAHAYCLQWSYSSLVQPNWNANPPTKCHLSSSIRLGRHKPPRDGNLQGQDPGLALAWTSGWKKSKFAAWTDHQRCKPQHQR